ncbi:MAG: hypothetical protein N3F64_02195 [Nitrososphaeria archaeon]|nr:hypothetical protein [Nitrososphaeria archaeon]
MNFARALDRHYIGSRYLNVSPSGAPYRYYTSELAEKICKLCRININRSKEIFEGIEAYKNIIVDKLKPKKFFFLVHLQEATLMRA